MSKNYGDFTTRSFPLTADFAVPSNSYAEVQSTTAKPFLAVYDPLIARKDFYDAGETISFSDYDTAERYAIVLVYENSI